MTAVSSSSVSRTPDMNAFLSLGFRPLYIAGCAWALVSVALWVFTPNVIRAPFNGLSWHAHEMLWAFIATIAVGFLLTASATWTRFNPLKGAGLGAVVALWAIARAGYLIGGDIAFWIAAISETAFFGVSGVCLMSVMVRGQSRRNYGLPVMILGLGLINILYLRAVLAGDYTLLLQRFNLGMVCMALIVLLIGRRVVPFFAMRMVPGLSIPMQMRSGHVQLGLTVLAIAAGLAHMPKAMAIALALTGLISVAQIIRWKPMAVRHKPMLWILYIGYAITGIGLLVAALQISGIGQGVFARTAAHVHIIGMGGFSILIIGMITRTALGHLGRPLALDASMLVSYYFMIAAVAFRIAALWPSAWYKPLLDAAALSWIVCMGLYLWRFVPMLIRQRH